MEHLVQVIVPLRDNDGEPVPAAAFEQMHRELIERFHGVTAHLRSPALGAWRDENGRTDHENVVMYEVFCERLDRCWWHDYRRHLEARFRQKEVHVRAVPVEKL